MTVRYNGDFLGVKCDACGRIFWTNYQGQSFPQHIRDAKENGWIHKKLGDRWKDFCPDCHEYELQKRREAYFRRENADGNEAQTNYQFALEDKWAR